MKAIRWMAAASILIPAAVWAQTAPRADCGPQPAAANGAQAQTKPYDGHWVPPYGEPVHQKTRAEVYQELIDAEKDGQLDYLNSTLYAH